ncbi:MAG: relaxase/mobilization nuclease domain-containing protein [Caldisericaceae bacterium]
MIVKAKFIHSSKGLYKAIDYIMNAEKINDSNGNSTAVPFMCSTRNPKADFKLLHSFSLCSRYSSSARRVLYAIHLIIAFSPSDKEKGIIDVKKVQEIGREFVEMLTAGNHQYFLVVHLDKPHLHDHILINPVTLKDFSRSNPFFCGHPKKLHDRIVEINNFLTEKYGLVNAAEIGAQRKELAEFEKEQKEIEKQLEKELEELERTERED